MMYLKMIEHNKIVEKKLSKPIHLAFSYDEEIGCVGVHGLLELIEKTILSTMYVCQINENNPTDIIKKNVCCQIINLMIKLKN